jgi:hypothetical protein
MDDSEVGYIQQILLEWAFAFVLFRSPRQQGTELCRILDKRLHPLRLVEVCDTYHTFPLSSVAMRVAIRFYKSQNMVDGR